MYGRKHSSKSKNVFTFRCKTFVVNIDRGEGMGIASYADVLLARAGEPKERLRTERARVKKAIAQMPNTSKP